LHGRAEAAIAAFRSSFDAAFAGSSPGVPGRLRRGASGLMRVAARTTMVLDRLNADAQRVASRTPDDRFASARPPSWSGAGRSVQEGSPDGATQKAASC